MFLPRNRAFFHMLALTFLGDSVSGAFWPLIHIYFICNLWQQLAHFNEI